MEEVELRKTVGGTVYSLEQLNSLWVVKADGQPVSYPASYEFALAGYRDLTR
jgi:hypothetical protein